MFTLMSVHYCWFRHMIEVRKLTVLSVEGSSQVTMVGYCPVAILFNGRSSEQADNLYCSESVIYRKIPLHVHANLTFTN